MRGHDHLTNGGLLYPPHQFQKLHLARGRQRRFRFVEDEDALPLAALFEETQKAFAMGMREEVWPALANFARTIVEISGHRKETLCPEEPALGDLRKPARTERV